MLKYHCVDTNIRGLRWGDHYLAILASQIQIFYKICEKLKSEDEIFSGVVSSNILHSEVFFATNLKWLGGNCSLYYVV